MKKRVIAFFLILTVLFSLASCESSNLQNLFNGNGNSKGEENFSEESNIKKLYKFTNNDFSMTYEVEKTVFSADEELKIKYSFDYSHSSKLDFAYYETYLFDLITRQEYLVSHVDSSQENDDYIYNSDSVVIYNNLRTQNITVPKELLNKSEGHILICTSIVFGSENSEKILSSLLSYKIENGKIYINQNEYIPSDKGNQENDGMTVVQFPVQLPDSSYFIPDDSGYELGKIEFDFYFGRHYHGTAAQHKKEVADLGNASVYVEDESGERILLIETEEPYISDKYKLKCAQIVNQKTPKTMAEVYTYQEYMKYPNSERVTIPAEMIKGDMGSLFISVYAKEAGSEEEKKLSTLQIYYLVDDGRVYLSRRFEPKREETLQFWIHDGIELLNNAENISASYDGAFFDKKYALEDGTCGENAVIYYTDNAEISSIQIYDPNASLYGLTVNSTKEEFIAVFESMGYTITDTENLLLSSGISTDNKVWLRARRGNVVVDLCRNFGRNLGTYIEICSQTINYYDYILYEFQIKTE